jgi:hypothetical protein
MTDTVQGQEITIANSLRKCSPSVEQIRYGQWKFILSNGANLHVTARMEEEWLLLDAPLPNGGKYGPTVSKGVWELLQGTLLEVPLPNSGKRGLTTPRSVWELLQWNAQVPGGGKFVILPDEQSAHLCAEILLDDEVDLAGRIRDTCAGFKMALEKVRGGKTGDDQADSHPVIFAADPVQDTGYNLPRLCHEVGWPFTERSAERLVVDLEVPDGFYQAIIEERMSRVHVWVELVACESLPQSCRHALGVLLLRACRIVMARATAEEREDRTTARFEVVFASPPCTAELARSLSALSVACRFFGREAKVLQQDEVVAREYLALQGWCL